MTIPIGGPNIPDRLIWAGNKNGEYSAKSGYRFLEEQSWEESNPSSSEDTLTKKVFWNLIWDLKVPSKIRSFLWRLSHDIVPTKRSLRARLHGNFKDQDVCPHCYHLEESAEHLLFFCPFAQAVWKASGFNYSPAEIGFPGFPKWWCMLRQDKILGLSVEGYAHLAFILWNIWKARNTLVFEGRKDSPWDVWLRADRAFVEFQQANKQDSSPKPKDAPKNTMWVPPPPGVIKINCDAAFDVASGKASIAAIFMDCSSSCLLGVSAPCWAPSVAAAEAYAIQLGLRTANLKAFANVIVEADNKPVIYRLSSGDHSDWVTSAIEENIKELTKLFESCYFSFVSRSCNMAADWLAKFAKTEQAQAVWSPAVFPSHLLPS